MAVMKYKAVGAVLALVGALAAGQAAAASKAMMTGAVTSQPIGHYEFCETHRDECNVRSPNKPAPKVTEFGWNLVREINVAVNHEIEPMTDKELYGRDEVWAYPKDAGDCEDYALLKRKRLMEKGFSASDLLITVVRKPDGEGHAVLTLRTDAGDFILDNLEDNIKIWTETSYHFLKRQAAFHSGRWVTIDNAGELMVGAVAK